MLKDRMKGYDYSLGGVNRRKFLTTVLYGSAAIAIPGVATTAFAGNSAKVPVALDWLTNVDYAGFWRAMDSGFYAEEDVEVTMKAGGPGSPRSQVAVVSGDSLVGIGGGMLPLIDAVRKGNDLVMFAAQYQSSPVSWLSLSSNPVRKAEDLIGKRILAQEAVRGSLKALMAVNGLPNDYEFIPAGFTPDPLINGQGDVYNCFATNQPIILETVHGMKEGKDFVVTPWSKMGYPQYSNFFYTQRRTLKEQHDILTRFLIATIKGFEQHREDPSVAARLAVEVYGKQYGLNLAQQTRYAELQQQFIRSDLTDEKGLLWVDPKLIEGPIFNWMRISGRDDLPSIKKFVDLSVLEAAYGGATSLLGS